MVLSYDRIFYFKNVILFAGWTNCLQVIFGLYWAVKSVRGIVDGPLNASSICPANFAVHFQRGNKNTFILDFRVQNTKLYDRFDINCYLLIA